MAADRKRRWVSAVTTWVGWRPILENTDGWGQRSQSWPGCRAGRGGWHGAERRRVVGDRCECYGRHGRSVGADTVGQLCALDGLDPGASPSRYVQGVAPPLAD